MSIQYIKDKLLVGTMYAPFCRTKYVDTSEWEQDIRRMAEMGYTCLHGFSEWWRVEKQKGIFDFSEQDYLIELCVKYGIVPIINVATQNGVGYYMPRWMQNEYKGRGVIAGDGQANDVDCEYVLPCMDDPWYQAYSERYLKALATHYAGDDRVGGWVIWGEPLLHKNGKPICYCEHTVARFREWLKNRYGTIESLNERWGSEGPHDHVSFAEIYPPVGPSGQRGGFASWADWQSFMSENFAGHISKADRIFKACGAMQPTITEMFCHISSDSICNDLWRLAETSDIVGVSQYARPGFETDIALTVANSVAQRLNKSIFIVEALGGHRYPTADNRTPMPRELMTEAVQMIGSNAKGLMYWCYRPRLTDFEGGRYGMCRADGKPLPRVYEGGRTAARMVELQELLLEAKRPADVAILYSTRTVTAAGCEGLSNTVQEAVLGALKLMLDAHIPSILVEDEMLEKGLPESIKALILPFAYALNEETLEGIRRFAERGGVVIADQHLAFKRQNGYIYRQLPGGCMRDLFGIEVDDWVYMDHASLVPANNYGIITDTVYDILLPISATVMEGTSEVPLITHNSFGRGEAWYFAWQAFVCYKREGGIPALREKVRDILTKKGVIPFVFVENKDHLRDPGISASKLQLANGKRAITLVNPSYEPTQLKVVIPNASKVTAMIGTDAFTQCVKGNDLEVSLSFGAWDSTMFIVED